MKSLIIFSVFTVLVFSGCSAKEFNDGVDSISSDISNAFEEGKDKSAD